jgi:hypothetical protein
MGTTSIVLMSTLEDALDRRAETRLVLSGTEPTALQVMPPPATVTGLGERRAIFFGDFILFSPLDSTVGVSHAALPLPQQRHQYGIDKSERV